VIWDIDPVLIEFEWLSSPITNGPLQIRFYGVFFAIGLLGAAWAFPVYFEKWGFPRRHGERLTLWTPLGMILGAHLIHLIFYETHVFSNFFTEPNAVTWDTLWRRLVQIGSGLASHGGGLGAILAVLFFAQYHKVKDKLAYFDPSMCAATFVIPWVRVGNFFNSEIVGRETDLPFGIYFPRHECPQFSQLDTGQAQELCQEVVYRHPSQVYEAILAFAMLGLSIWLMARLVLPPEPMSSVLSDSEVDSAALRETEIWSIEALVPKPTWKFTLLELPSSSLTPLNSVD